MHENYTPVCGDGQKEKPEFSEPCIALSHFYRVCSLTAIATLHRPHNRMWHATVRAVPTSGYRQSPNSHHARVGQPPSIVIDRRSQLFAHLQTTTSTFAGDVHHRASSSLEKTGVSTPQIPVRPACYALVGHRPPDRYANSQNLVSRNQSHSLHVP